MDWAKAKTVLIIALIITDIFLIFNYFSDSDRDGDIEDKAKLITILEENGISIDRIPEGHGDLPALTVRYKDPAREDIEALINSTDIMVTEDPEDDQDDIIKKYKEAAGDFAGYLGMTDTKPGVSAERKNDEVNVYFRCERSGYRIDGSYMKCTFRDGRITDFRSRWFEPSEISEKKFPTMPASVALISYMNSRKDKDPVHIKEMEMVYWVNEDTYSDGKTVIEDTALPAWKIVLDTGSTVYIDAVER